MMDSQIALQLGKRDSPKIGGPFRATQLWNDVVKYLKEHIGRKRRRVKMKLYDNCFSSSDAVDVVFLRLLHHKETFNKEVNREKAIKLCQLMVENNVFEPVGVGKRRSHKILFEDSSSKFYRFCEDDEEESLCTHDINHVSTSSSKDSGIPSNESSSFDDLTEIPHLNDSVLSDEDGANSSLYNSSLSMSRTSKHSHIVQEIMDLTGTWKRYSSQSLRKRLKTPARLFKSCPSLPSSEIKTEDSTAACNNVPPAVEDELWKEVALARLLTFLDIPLLDGILSYDITQCAKPSMAYSNLAFRRVESISSLFSDKQDVWLEAATDVLELIPEGFDLLDRSLNEENDHSQKLRMYQTIAEYYQSKPEPMWPQCFADLHLGLLNLLMQGKRDVVLKSVQMSLLLLPSPVREEIKCLLAFMKQASDQTLKLSFTMDNRQLLEKTFTPAIIKDKILTPHQAGQLILFMMDHADKLCDVPDDVEDLVLARIDELTHGMKPPVKEVAFCNRVSRDEYKKQQAHCTNMAIVDLMNAIIDDTKLSLKEKKSRLKQFQKTYPKLYEERFSDMKW